MSVLVAFLRWRCFSYLCTKEPKYLPPTQYPPLMNHLKTVNEFRIPNGPTQFPPSDIPGLSCTADGDRAFPPKRNIDKNQPMIADRLE